MSLKSSKKWALVSLKDAKAIIAESLLTALGVASIATLSIALPSYAQDTSHPLALRDAVSMAVSNNPLLRETAEKINQMEATIPLDRSSLFPNLSIINKAGEQKNAVNVPTALFGGDPYNNYSSDIHLTQSLYTYGSVRAIRSAEKDRDIAKINTQISARDLTSQVVQAYYQVVLNMRTVDTYRQQLAITVEALGTAERRARTGRGQVLDVLQTRTQLALLKSQITTSENTVQTAAASLASLIGDTRPNVFLIKDSLEAPNPDIIDHEVDLKNFKLPELERNNVSLLQIDDQKAVALGQNLPTLSFTGDYMFNAYKQSDVLDADAVSWALGVQLTIPLFSGFSTSYQQQVLDSEKMQLEFDRLNIQNQTSLQQVTSRKNLETAQASIIEGQEALRLAIASSDEARRMYRFSTIDFLQLLTVEQSLVTAESSFYQYKYNYIVALASYFVASGQDSNHLIELLERANR